MRNLVFAAAALALVAAEATAQERPAANLGKFYVGIAPGYVSAEDVNFSGNASTGGYSANASGKFEFKDGYSISAFAGYQFNDYLRAEAELGYAKFDYDKVSLSGTITGNGSTVAVNGSADLDGSVSSTVGLLSGIVTPLGKGKVTPLLGAGIGFAVVEDEVNRIGTTNVNLSNTETDLALAGMVGVEVAVSNSVALGARYRYLWVDSGSNGVDDLTVHNFTATAALKF